jgi:hypothetical protein
MAKQHQHPSLEALAGAVVPKPPPATGNVISLAPAAAKPKWRAHTSLYISKPVQRMIRRIAADLDKKPHDVLIEAVNDMLIKYGKPGIAEIDRQ